MHPCVIECGAVQRFTHDQLAYYQFDAFRQAGLRHGVFTRLGGVSEGQWASLNMSCSTGDAAEPVIENRRRALDALGLKPQQSLTSWLVHGNHVRTVTQADLRSADTNDVHADAMITRDRGLALTLRFADCIPVLLFDPFQGAIGIAHAGWKGIVNGVLQETVRTMQRAFGSQPHTLVAGVGPCIGPNKFEVGGDVAAGIQQAVHVPIIKCGATDKPYINLGAAARAQLEDTGVANIQVSGVCTASDTREWFSHRAERGKTGRFGVIIALD